MRRVDLGKTFRRGVLYSACKKCFVEFSFARAARKTVKSSAMLLYYANEFLDLLFTHVLAAFTLDHEGAVFISMAEKNNGSIRCEALKMTPECPWIAVQLAQLESVAMEDVFIISRGSIRTV
jgi:hypothetical protein